MQQTDSTAYKLKPRLFHKSAYLWIHSANFYPNVNHAWQYYQTSQVCCHFWAVLPAKSSVVVPSAIQLVLHTSKSKWLPLTITFQLWFYCLGHPSIWSCVSVTRWLICQMHYNTQDKFTKETVHLQSLLPVQFNLTKQFCLFLAQVLSLQTTILIRKMLLLILLLTLLQLIDSHLLLTHSQNPTRVRILMNNWLTYLADLLTLLILIRLPVPILIQEKLKPIFPTPSEVLSLISSIIFCSNTVYISVLIQHNST